MHDKCFMKLQNLIGCACIGDKILELIEAEKKHKNKKKLNGRRRDSSSAVKAETSTTKRSHFFRA